MSLLPQVGKRKVALYLYSIHLLTLLLVMQYISGGEFIMGFSISTGVISGTLVAERFAPSRYRAPDNFDEEGDW